MEIITYALYPHHRLVMGSKLQEELESDFWVLALGMAMLELGNFVECRILDSTPDLLCYSLN